MLESNHKTAIGVARKEMFSLLLNVMDLAVESCKSVQLRSDLAAVERRLQHARRLYARAVARSSYYRMTPQDVARLELRSARLKREISKLEKRLRDRRVEPLLGVDAESSNVFAA